MTFLSHAGATFQEFKMPIIEQKTFQRQVAYKVNVSDILNCNFIKDEFSAGYVKVNNMNVSRINIIATVVYKPEETNFNAIVVDDGTGRISLRSFENNNVFSKIDVGDTSLVIGKIREFNNEKYIMPEIIKKINNFEWLNVRKLELIGKNIVDNIKTTDNVVEEVTIGINEDIYSLIKKLDNGDGVSVDDVVKASNKNEAEHIINKLLENGDIFEIKPGKLKVLE